MKKKSIVYTIFRERFLVLIVFLAHCFLLAQTSKENPALLKTSKNDSLELVLDKKWMVSPDDRPEYAQTNFDDRSWKEISKVDIKNYSKIYWQRNYFKIDSSLVGKPLMVRVMQNGASEIFLDGKRLDVLGKIDVKDPKYKIKNNNPKIITISDTLTHVLSVRIQPVPRNELSSIVSFSGSNFYMYFTLASDYFPETLDEDKSFYSIVMLITGIFMALGFIHLLLFLFYRNAVYNLFFGIYNLSIALMSFLLVKFYQMEDPTTLISTTFWFYISFAAFCFSLSGFVNTLFGKRKLRFYILSIFPVLGICIFYFSNEWASLILLLYLISVTFESFFLIIRAMWRREKSAFIVGGGILVFFVAIVALIITLILNGGSIDPDSDFLSKYFPPIAFFILFSFPVSISAYLAWQFAATNIGLTKQLVEVNRLSDLTIQQEQEKQNILQNQNEILEEQVEKRTSELQVEKQKSEDLLLNILPQEVAQELKDKGKSKAKYYDEVSVLFTDFVNFTATSEKIGVQELLEELNVCFTEFDNIMGKHGLEKIKTIGDAYLAVSGLPTVNKDHAKNAIAASQDILKFIEERKKVSPNALDLRIGIHSGQVIAGIVGVKKFAYDIWGDTVNTAARMEQAGEKGKINISKNTYELVKDDFGTTYRGKISVKGKGEMEMYFVEA
ncbi:Adenylate cyclase, class 3 [Soonwooa buanensis]|uniref:Adenylate cyclase n=1 Tax=Soonwooa buanensis TaxID=619805 RepID=A0A1T5G721_9FLAO|nr:adenylate/guanylate cyclase domain-containing protein [Soonwooa buanensis]SKC04205.1 Adenylate cyclase, class 3 [Soonwooa buanensis]